MSPAHLRKPGAQLAVGEAGQPLHHSPKPEHF